MDLAARCQTRTVPVFDDPARGGEHRNSRRCRAFRVEATADVSPRDDASATPPSTRPGRPGTSIDLATLRVRPRRAAPKPRRRAQHGEAAGRGRPCRAAPAVIPRPGMCLRRGPAGSRSCVYPIGLFLSRRVLVLHRAHHPTGRRWCSHGRPQ